MSGKKRNRGVLKPTGREQRKVRRVELTACIVDELDFSVYIDQLEGNFDLFTPVHIANKVKNGDLIVPRTRISCNKNAELLVLRKELRKFWAQCAVRDSVGYVGNNYILEELKNRRKSDETVKKFKYWSNCTQYLGPRYSRGPDQKEVQKIIYEIVWKLGLDSITWDALSELVISSNRDLHPNKTLSAVLDSLQRNILNVPLLETSCTYDYTNAVDQLKDVLEHMQPAVDGMSNDVDDDLADMAI